MRTIETSFLAHRLDRRPGPPPVPEHTACYTWRPASNSELAHQLGIGRPLLHMHLQILERAGLVAGRHEISADGKALRYFEVVDFEERLTPEHITRAVRTLRADESAGTGRT